MPPVDAKIGVEREDFARRVDFREPHQTSTCQGHGPVAIAAHESPQFRLLVLYRERDANHAPLKQCKIASASWPSRSSRKAVSVRTGSHVSSGGRWAFSFARRLIHDASVLGRGILSAARVQQGRDLLH